jgi:hypothetical protein
LLLAVEPYIVKESIDDCPVAPSVTAFGRDRVQVPLVVIVHVPVAVIWLAVPATVTLVTVPEPVEMVQVDPRVQV